MDGHALPTFLRSGPGPGITGGGELPGIHLDWSGTCAGQAHGRDALWRHPDALKGIAGIYVLWSDGPTDRRCLYVGAGRDIGERLAAQRNDPRIACRAESDHLAVQWAAVASIHREGVAAFLTAALAPLFCEPAIAARAIPVNLPA